MGMLWASADGWKYESDNEITYSIYEGFTFGGEETYTSDMYFIMLDGYDEEIIDANAIYDWKELCVGWGHGATQMETDYGYEIAKEEIEQAVNKFERAHEKIVKAIGKVYPFTDDAEKMADFFSLTKDEFLASYNYLTEREYDETAREVAKFIVDWKKGR